MEVKTLQNAIAEAERFIQAAKKVEIIREKFLNGKPWFHIKTQTKETAACKRASLDLSRALSEMRKQGASPDISKLPAVDYGDLKFPLTALAIQHEYEKEVK